MSERLEPFWSSYELFKSNCLFFMNGVKVTKVRSMSHVALHDIMLQL
jgi:hypothetical protein